MGNLRFTYEEFLTILNQIEGVLNSRPLYPLSCDPGDFDALTPGHFLVGRPITAIAEPSLTEVSGNSVVPAKTSSQSSRHCWRSPLPHTSALIQRDFGYALGVQQTKQLPHVAKIDLVWKLGGNLSQPLSNRGAHVFYQRKIWRASRPGKQFNLVIEEEPLDNACHVWSRIILLKYGCDQALKVRQCHWLFKVPTMRTREV
ncbi:uncharacterized protein TNCV_2839711 [Trichonephila clavipes]|nr:uncharacterized protein TNCV_2839711 [Trichonephila clavipes]